MAGHLWSAAAADNKWKHFPKPQHINEASFRDIFRKSGRIQRFRTHSGWQADISATIRNQTLPGNVLEAWELSVGRGRCSPGSLRLVRPAGLCRFDEL